MERIASRVTDRSGRAHPAGAGSSRVPASQSALAGRGATPAVPSDRALADAEEAAFRGGRLVRLPCSCGADVECVERRLEDGGYAYAPTEAGASVCSACGEVVCRRCTLARRHPSPLACEVEQKAIRRAGVAC
jgi:hypothetical protein